MSGYPKFIYNNQSVIIKPGQDFSSNELKLRLKTMGLDANNFQNKSSLIKLYDISIKTDENKIKYNQESYNSLPLIQKIIIKNKINKKKNVR